MSERSGIRDQQAIQKPSGTHRGVFLIAYKLIGDWVSGEHDVSEWLL